MNGTAACKLNSGRVITAVLLFAANTALGGVTASDLRCEYLADPLAIDVSQPRLSWILQADERGQTQSAYQILVASSDETLKENKGDLWDTGKVMSSESLHIAYAGRKLTSLQSCRWKVRVWDKVDKPSPWSESARWTMGHLASEDWHARWIAYESPEQGAAKKGPGVLPLFRREFSVQKPVARALVHVCGLGFYELHLNGQKVGDHVLDPGWTNYRKRCLYVAYDVTSSLKEGANALGIMLGNGMYNVTGGRYIKFKGTFGPPKVILQMRMEFTDGTSTEVLTDASWKAAAGPITFSCIYGGEDYDARLEQPGWDRAGFNDSTWRPAAVVEGPGGRLASQTAPPLKVIETFKPAKITEPAAKVIVYDLGQNASGWPQISVRGPAGSCVRMTPGELLDERGLVTQKGSGGPSIFSYTLKGEGTEIWRPRFTYYGFRYVQVDGAVRESDGQASGKPVIVDLEGQVVHSSARRVGEFSCSNDLFNKIHILINWAIRSNLQSVVTDCPHREKLGWLEVPHLLAPGIMFNFDVPTLYAKISDDMREAQLPNGLVPDIAPEYVVFNEGFRDSPEWGSACVIDPWYVLQRYGDFRIIEDNYKAMKKYVDFLTGRSTGHIVSHGLGDWCDYGPKPYGQSQNTPISLTATAIYYRDIQILVEAAKRLNRTDDVNRYSALARDVREAFNRKFLDSQTGKYATGSQTSQAMPLVVGLAEPGIAAAVLDNLVKEVRRLDNHLSAGDVGLRFLLQALADGGRSDVIFDMTNRRDVPSYGFQIEQGCTALAEVWDPRHGFSHNHCMLGHIDEWFYQDVAGIRPDPDSAGFNRIVIRPQVVGDLTSAHATYDSVRGRIESKWKLDAGIFTLEITIPPNTTATVYVPAKTADDVTEGGHHADKAEAVTLLRMVAGSAEFRVGSGRYCFTAPMK